MQAFLKQLREKPFLVALAAVGVVHGIVMFFRKSTKIDYLQGGGVLPQARAAYYASEMLAAMRNLGTDTSTLNRIYEEIKDTPAAIIDIAKAFGKQKYLFFGFSKWWGNDYDLKEWLRVELSKKDYKKWDNLFKNSAV